MSAPGLAGAGSTTASASSSWLGLEGARAVVIGAGGLGGETAVALAEVGASVVSVDRSHDAIEGLFARHPSISGLVSDVGTPDSARAAVRAAAVRLGGLDVFVHAVGVNDRRPVLELGDDDWDRLMRTNLSTAWWTGQEAGRVMCAAGRGRLVFVSSVSGLLAHADHSIYAASKGGINQMMRVMAREWAAAGVGVNAVGPGYVETELTRHHLDKDGVRDKLESQVPAGRLGIPREVADAITFLASPRAEFITGQVLYIDGGRTLV